MEEGDEWDRVELEQNRIKPELEYNRTKLEQNIIEQNENRIELEQKRNGGNGSFSCRKDRILPGCVSGTSAFITEIQTA